MDPLIAGLQAIVGARYCLTEPEAQAPFVTDWRGLYRGAARAVALPGTTAEVQAIVRLARQHLVPIVPATPGLPAVRHPTAAARQSSSASSA